jgi:predicted molibdopterin-dependent oxidoreductase YjgC
MQHRIFAHPILDFTARGAKVSITVDGRRIEAYEGEPIAAALAAAGIRVFRRTRKHKAPRGLYCAIGRCTDCVMTVDGVPSVRTCVTPVRDGMVVRSQDEG